MEAVMRRFLFCLYMVFGFSLFAGDAASYINLGFSSDNQYFMFGQYGVSISDGKSYAESFIIDVESNRYAKGGKLSDNWPVVPGLGMDSIGGLINLVRENNWLIKKYDIDHINNGKTVYFLEEGKLPENELRFRIFNDKSTITLVTCHLSQGQDKTGDKTSSWFFIDFSWDDTDGKKHLIKMGHPEIKRDGVLSYYIKNIILSPDLKSFIFVIAREEADANGVNLRYMVETVTID